MRKPASGASTATSSAPYWSWAEQLAQHAILAQQYFAATSRKNATDIYLVIDAMDLLHTNWFDGFCLVSSDSDFTRLASDSRAGPRRLRLRRTPRPTPAAKPAKRFFLVENLLPAAAKKALAPLFDRVIRPVGSPCSAQAPPA